MLTHTELLHSSLTPWRRWPVVDQIRSLRLFEIVVGLTSAISALGIILGAILWLSGAFAGATITANDVSAIRSQVTSLVAVVDKLQQRLDGGPRLDQLRDLDRNNSELRGTIQSMDARLRADEERITRALALIEGIDAASRAKLGR
jgi:hypothetical protein